MIQAKLNISTPGDRYEQEADRVADEMTRMPDVRDPRQAIPVAQHSPPAIQRDEAPPMSTTDPARGFRPQDLQAVKKLSFKGSLSPLSSKVQSLLLKNIEATVRFALDPKDPQRISELANLQSQHPKLPRFEIPAERVDYTDLYHGHICLPIKVLDKNEKLQKLLPQANPYRDRGKEKSIEEDIIEKFGQGVPTNKKEAQKLLPIVDKHREPFLKVLDPIIQELQRVPEAVVLYHTWENSLAKDKPPSGHPVRAIRTSLADNRPRFELPGSTHCEPLLNFSFHINRQGEITLLPGAVGEAVRAVEILFGWGPGPAPTTKQPTVQPKLQDAAPANSPASGMEDFRRREGSGHALPDSARRYFEPRFGQDLSHVRVHTDDRADASARSINALAYTAGNDIAFRSGTYAPDTVAGKRLLAHELTHVIQQQSGDAQVQRATVEEADISVLRAALLDGIREAHAFTRDQAARAQLDALEAQIPTMTAAQLRAAIPGVQQMAQSAQTAATSSEQALTPSSQPSTLDPLVDDFDLVTQASRNHQLYKLIQLLTTSQSFGAKNIRLMLSQMRTDLNSIHWFANNNVGFAAATVLEGVSGTPASAQIKVILGPSMIVMMSNPNEDMVPTLYHEIYHAYERFRTETRGKLPARPNLSQTEMQRRLTQLQGTPVAGDAGFGPIALSHARSVESELFADLITHSALQDPSVKGRTRTVATPSIITLNNARTTEGKIESGLEEIKLIFGETEGRRIALDLSSRANAEALIHADTRQMFQQLVARVFP